ncbi:RNA polymerase sigma factor [Neolewinella agarilytica]|uniref:RNA polymerase sigma factor, sigma-70 family n=1 Tax=Neolewinella agarilytica TaxID=478744 RepID=A0A1H9AHQ9_9BACT|nr:RNA polymerase sigma factor [Neolewinella agarilytica]SEP76017.1 RNA polymerase sigma factor, sigma-70 family [Neolewinella agarilytica]
MYEIEKTAWEEAYEAHAGELEAFARSRVGDLAAEDLLQELWSAFATALEVEEILQPRAWLYRVLRNRITDEYRTAARRPAFVDLDEEFDVEEESDGFPDPDDTWESIEEAFDLLPPDQREVFVRNELDGETLREIAEDLGLPLKTIISRKGYARRRLQDLLREVYDDYFGEE